MTNFHNSASHSEEEAVPVDQTGDMYVTAATGKGLALRALILLVLVGLAGVLSAVTFVPGFFLVAFLFIAPPYTIVATIFAVMNRKKASRTVNQIGYTPKDIPASAFRSSGQKNSLAINIILVVNLLVGVAIWLILGTDFGYYLFVNAAVVGVAAIVMIIANAPFIFSKETVEAEQYTLSVKGEGHQFIFVNRTWSWITWWAYSLASAAFLIEAAVQ